MVTAFLGTYINLCPYRSCSQDGPNATIPLQEQENTIYPALTHVINGVEQEAIVHCSVPERGRQWERGAKVGDTRTTPYLRKVKEKKEDLNID